MSNFEGINRVKTDIHIIINDIDNRIHNIHCENTINIIYNMVKGLDGYASHKEALTLGSSITSGPRK